MGGVRQTGAPSSPPRRAGPTTREERAGQMSSVWGVETAGR